MEPSRARAALPCGWGSGPRRTGPRAPGGRAGTGTRFWGGGVRRPQPRRPCGRSAGAARPSLRGSADCGHPSSAGAGGCQARGRACTVDFSCVLVSRTSIGTSAPTTRHLSITTLNTHAELTFRPLVLAITFRLPSHAHASHPRRGAPRVRATRPGRPRDREASRAADRSPPWTDHTRAPGDGARASLPR